MVTPVHRQVLGPVIIAALVNDPFAGLEAVHLIGPGAGRRHQIGVVEGLVVPVMLGHHRQLADDHHQLAVVAGLEAEFHLALGQRLDLFHVTVIVGVEGRAFVAQLLEAPHHVLGAHRVSVGEAGLLAQGEGDPAAVLGPFHGFGQQAVFGEGFILAAHRQGVEHQTLGAGRRLALGQPRLEIIEAAHHVQAQAAAFGGVRPDVVEVLEAGGVFGFAVHGDGVGALGLRQRRAAKQGGNKEQTAH